MSVKKTIEIEAIAKDAVTGVADIVGATVTFTLAIAKDAVTAVAETFTWGSTEATVPVAVTPRFISTINWPYFAVPYTPVPNLAWFKVTDMVIYPKIFLL